MGQAGDHDTLPCLEPNVIIAYNRFLISRTVPNVSIHRNGSHILFRA